MIFHGDQTILMKYNALFVIFEKVANLKLSSAANYRWRFMQYDIQLAWLQKYFTHIVSYQFFSTEQDGSGARDSDHNHHAPCFPTTHD